MEMWIGVCKLMWYKVGASLLCPGPQDLGEEEKVPAGAPYQSSLAALLVGSQVSFQE